MRDSIVANNPLPPPPKIEAQNPNERSTAEQETRDSNVAKNTPSKAQKPADMSAAEQFTLDPSVAKNTPPTIPKQAGLGTTEPAARDSSAGKNSPSTGQKPADLSAAKQAEPEAAPDSNVAKNSPLHNPPTTAQTPADRTTEQSTSDPIIAQNPPPSTPKSKWAQPGIQRAAFKSTGLSAAEQAMRAKIVASNQQHQPPPPAQGKQEQQNKERTLNTGLWGHQLDGQGNKRAPRDKTRRHNRKPFQESNPFQQHNSYRERNPFQEKNPFQASAPPAQDQPRYGGTDIPNPNLMNMHETKNVNKDQTSPSGGWRCPSCMARVLPHKVRCPFCKTPRLEQAESGSRKTKDHGYSATSSKSQHPSKDNTKFKELGNSILSEMDKDTQPETETTTAAERNPEESADAEEPASETDEADPNKPKKDPWAWDMSALERLENLEAEQQQQPKQQPAKQMKRRDGRKGRENRSEEGGDFDQEARERLRQDRRRQQKEKAARKAAKKAAPAPLYLPEFISVSNLADVIGVKPAQFVECMEEMGFEDISYRDVLDAETAGLVAAEYNFEAIFDTGADDLEAAPVPEDTSDLPSRPPVVTIMGHVDHGKTTILDWLRKSSVAASEHGGITQHIGAFSVNMPGGKAITFLDTPGHSAFLEMRRRGADVTDIVVLVVAADDSVKPQTIEAIKHANSAKVPVIVAISKIDKEGKNLDKVKSDLSAHGVHVEDFGGDVQAIGVSGKTGAGMVELEEAIIALSEMLDHRADTACNAEGWVIEASTKSYGRVASALIRRGTLRPGDIIVAGTTWARVRTLRNEAGVAISEATPGMPVEIDGWRDQPGAGTEILQAPNEQKAKDVVDYRLEKSDTQKMGIDMAAINEARREIAEQRRREKEDEDAAAQSLEPTGPKPVNFLLKADVDGSVEAVLNTITAIGNNEVFANVIRSGVGPVSEFDIEHAATAQGRVISFNQPIDPNMSRIAEAQGVEIMDHNIIYKLTDEVKSILSDQLPPTVITRVTGEAEVREVFEITIKGREKMSIAGSRVRNGMINKSRKVRVIREDETIYEGKKHIIPT